MQNLKKHHLIYIGAGVLMVSIVFFMFIKSKKYKSMLDRKKRYIATSELSAMSYGLIKESDINVDYIISMLEGKKLLNAQLLKEDKSSYKRTFSTGQAFVDAEVEEGLYYILEGSILVKLQTKKLEGADLSNGDNIARPNNDLWVEVNK